MRQPPHGLQMIPIGILSVLVRRLANMYATAEMPAVVLLSVLLHTALTSSFGSYSLGALMLNTLIYSEYSGASRMFSTLSSTGCPPKPLTNISMLDCPVQSHTSPLITSSRSILSLPLVTDMVYGPPASGVFRKQSQRPFSSAVAVTADFLFHEPLTRTFAPGSAHPHTLTEVSR